jgi:hypothetical protein
MYLSATENTLGYTRVDFNRRLHHRDSVFSVYLEDGYTKDPRDSELLVEIMSALLTDDSAIERITVEPFVLEVHANSTATSSEIYGTIVAAARKAGYNFETKHVL